jgi:hypothetical protein
VIAKRMVEEGAEVLLAIQNEKVGFDRTNYSFPAKCQKKEKKDR